MKIYGDKKECEAEVNKQKKEEEEELNDEV